MKKITDFLQDLGLTDIEATVYQGLVETGPTTVKGLADHIGIKRITTHFNVENLINKGLIIQTIRGNRRQIAAELPERLEYFLEQKENQIKNLRNDFSDIVQVLSSTTQQKGGENIQIEYYEGKSAVQAVYREVLKAKKIFTFANINQVRTIFPQNKGLFEKSIDENSNQEIWEIFEATKETRNYVKKANKKYHYCFFPEGISFSNFDFIVFDDNVAMVYLHTENPYAVISHSSVFAKGFQAIHRIVWRVLSGKDY